MVDILAIILFHRNLYRLRSFFAVLPRFRVCCWSEVFPGLKFLCSYIVFDSLFSHVLSLEKWSECSKHERCRECR